MFDKPLDAWPEIINHNEKYVVQKLQEFQESGRLTCACRECSMDVLALALNMLPPRYTVSIMQKYHQTPDEQRAFDAEVSAAVDRAVKKVQAHPHH